MAFNGSSSFVPDLQQTIDRAVAIASLPLVQLRAQKAKLESQGEALSGLNDQFAGLQTAIEAVTSSITTDLHSASVGDETIAKVTLSGSVLAADYSLEVIGLGARTLTMNLDSLPVVTDPFLESISASGEFTLSAGGVDSPITPAGGSLFALAAAINAGGAGVQATVVNIGGSSSPDYRLSLQSEAYSNVSIQLNDGAQDLLQTLTTGSEATYRINGVPAQPISSDSRTITISPGLTVNLLETGTTDIQVSKSTSSLADALETFVTAYNSAVAGVDAHRGVNGGILSGQSVLSALSRPLSQLSTLEAGAGAIRSLADLGISLSNEGTLSLDRTAFEAVPVDDVLAFLGDPSTTGFL
jgi:flagellar hook-associated protein 2